MLTHCCEVFYFGDSGALITFTVSAVLCILIQRIPKIGKFIAG